jgi:hypothetical protein
MFYIRRCIDMTKTKFKLVLAAVLIVLSFCIVFTFCQNDSTQPQELLEMQNEPVRVNISGLLAAKDIPQLIMESDIIVFGKVIEASDPIKICPVGGGDYSLFTDYYFDAIDVLKSSELFDNMNRIPVRIHGGVTKDLIVVHGEEPKLTIGNEYLLFLFKPGMGAGYNTEGEYCYVTGATQGTYSFVNNDGIQKLVPQLGTQTLTMGELKQQINDFSSVAVKTKMEIFKENLLKNIESGFISEDEYSIFLDEANTYATIIN